jgi:hypothetical protein
VCVEAWSTPAIPDSSCFLGRFSLVSAKRVESFEDKAAVVAEQLVQSEHTDEKHRIVIIALNTFAFTPRALHRTILATLVGSNLPKLSMIVFSANPNGLNNRPIEE